MLAVVIILIVIAVAAYVLRYIFAESRAVSKRLHHSEILKTLLGLDDGSLKELLRLYRAEFGPGPARYAKRTYSKWKNGEVRPSGQTFRRFMLHLPKVMSFDLKCEVLRHLMEEYCSRTEYGLTVHTDDWEETLTPIVTEMIEKAYTAELPAEIKEKLEWLSDGEMMIARDILRHSQVEEGKIAVSRLRSEFESMNGLLTEFGERTKVNHRLELPYGTIDLTVKKR